MKKLIFYLAVFGLTFCLITLQTLNCKAQTYSFCPGDTITHDLPTYRGSLQWQESTDSLSWSDITGATYQPFITVFATAKYFRAKITEASCNPVYSQIRHAVSGVCFTCGTSPITDYNGNVYNTVLIGSQCWMRENLKATHYSDGTAMLDGTSAGDITGNYTSKYYFDYADTPSNTVIYGKLYTWAAVMNGAASSNGNPSGVQGVCPTGWHVPSDAEWNIMEKYLDNTVDTTSTTWSGTDIGIKLKEAGTSHWNSGNTGTNSSGFTALPGGVRDYSGSSANIGNRGYWWTSKETNSTSAWTRELSPSQTGIVRDFVNLMSYGFSVRCLRDF